MIPTLHGRVAQLVEQLTFNQLVVGSIPTAVTPQEPLFFNVLLTCLGFFFLHVLRNI